MLVQILFGKNGAYSISYRALSKDMLAYTSFPDAWYLLTNDGDVYRTTARTFTSVFFEFVDPSDYTKTIVKWRAINMNGHRKKL